MTRLSRLLRLRSQVRLLREHEAGALQRRLATLADEAAAVAAVRERAGEHERAATAAGTLTPEMLRLGRDYADALASAERMYARAIGEAEQSLASKREELVTSHREESKVRRLEEMHRARVTEERARHTAQRLDEAAIDRHQRARRQR